MNTSDEGLIIYTKNIKEKNLYIKILTQKNGLCTGIVYGGKSKKNNSIYQVGNFINFNLLKKNENLPPSISGDIISPLSSFIYDDKYKLYLILSCCSIVNSTIKENQIYTDIYIETKKLISNLSKKKWFYEFSNWILIYLSEIGYGIEISKINQKKRFINIDNLTIFDLNEFSNLKNNDYIEFPFELIVNKTINYKQCNLLFNFFECILLKHIYNNSKYNIPNMYFDFKKIVLQRLDN
ncbi:MAG: DNA repair protein RecO [Pelagibacteraceae bacterium]|nr:DNA repair protein RecO [Pelagibacteraceae bacterium]|tara:strand:- start:2732 stop:3445 length:714 start_codon:yes stop_codon:yes gene_type:complete